MRVSTAVVVAALLLAPGDSVLIAQTPAPVERAPQAQPQAQPGSAAQTIELALEALKQGRMADAEALLSQAVMTLRRERMAAAAPAPSFGQAVRVGGDVPEPKKLVDVKPWYPAIAQAARVTGVVIIEAVIDEQGNVATTRVLRSIPLLDQAALDAVSQWKYTPTLLNGVPVSVIMTVTVNFSLTQP